jgi:ABC-type multidrug transport system ATPase subunit
MKILKNLAKSGRTIIQTIHQPNSEIYGLFDRLMLLASGKIIYFNDAASAIPYFNGIGYACPELTNPADHFMTIMSIESIPRPDVDGDDADAVHKVDEDVKE